MPEEELKNCLEAVNQLPFRTKVVQEWVQQQGYQISDFDIIAARGGPLPPVQGGAYRVNQLMVDVLTYAPQTTHESALACMIGMNLAKGTDVPVIVYDGTSVNELNEVAKYTGLPGVQFNGMDHPLNTRRVSKEVAGRLGRKYADCTFVTCHLGGSITVSALGLILCGLTLGKYSLKKLLNIKSFRLPLLRLVGMPLLFTGITRLLMLIGIDKTLCDMIVIYCALPCSAMTPMFALQYETDPDVHFEAAGCVFFGTILCTGTIPLWYFLLQNILS